MEKQFKLKPEAVKTLIDAETRCQATDMITVEGLKVGFMYRDEPDDNLDSGWRFLSGTETQKYVNNPENSEEFELNEMANYDPAIIPYLEMPFGTELERVEGTDLFREIEQGL